MIKDALIAVQNKLVTIESLRYVAEDWGQLDNYEIPPATFPCALVDGAEIDFSNGSRGRQQAVAKLTVRIGAIKKAVSMQSPNSESEFSILDLLSEINSKLHGLDGDRFSPLTRLRVQKITRDDTIKEYVVTYEFSYTDLSGYR